MWDHFEVSVPMSTYTVAYSVSAFKHRESQPTDSGVTIRVWTRPDYIDQVDRRVCVLVARMLESI